MAGALGMNGEWKHTKWELYQGRVGAVFAGVVPFCWDGAVFAGVMPVLSWVMLFLLGWCRAAGVMQLLLQWCRSW